MTDTRAGGSESSAEVTLAAEIRRCRRAAGVSQAELAVRIGYSRQYVSRAERPATGFPSADLVRGIDTALGAEGALIELHRHAVEARLARRDRAAVATVGETAASAFGRSTVLPGSTARVDSAGARSELAYELFLRSHGLLPTNDRGRIGAATVLLDRALDIDPGFARARAARGYARWRTYFSGWTSSPALLDAALDDVATALRCDPHSVTAVTAMVRICWDKGWHEKAVALSRRTHLASPASLEGLLAYARALHNAGMAEIALPLTRSVLQMDPGNPTALKLLIWNHLMLGEHLSAIQAARWYLPQAPADANTRWAAASAHFHAGDHREAIRVAREAASSDPDDITVRSLLGHLLRRAGHGDAAREAWFDALSHFTDRPEMTPELSPRTQAWLAGIEACLGRRRQAEARLGAIAAAEPDNGYLHYRSAHAWAEMGERHRAVRSLSQAVRDGFRSVQLLRHDESFELAGLVAEPAYQHAVDDLDRAVADLRRRYAPPLPVDNVSGRVARDVAAQE